MMSKDAGNASPVHARLLLLDAVLAVWVALWVWTGLEVRLGARDLAGATGRVEEIGGAVVETGRALESLGSVPVVGDRVSEAAEAIQRQGAEAQAVAREGRRGGNRLANLLGLAVALIPSLPVVTLYLPYRVRFLRDRRAAVRAPDALLAARARVHLPLAAVVRLGDDEAALAAAERRRLGIDPRR